MGNNAASLSDDQERALHYIHIGEYEDAQAAVKKAMAARKTVIGRIRAEGGNLDQIKTSIRLQTPEGEAEVADEVKHAIQAARWAGAELGLQLDLFDQDRADATRQYEQGKTAGLKGETPNTQDQDWLTGWHAGQDALAATLSLFRAEPRRISPTDSVDTPEPEPDQPVEADQPDAVEPFEVGDPPWMPPEDLTEGETENLADPQTHEHQS